MKPEASNQTDRWNQRDSFLTTSHADFVRGYHSGRIALTWDRRPAYVFAAAQSRCGWEWWFTGYFLQLLGGPGSISLLFVILTFTLRDPWLLLGVPAAFVGSAAGAAGHNAHTRRVSVFFIMAAFLGLIVWLFGDKGWRSPVFLISCGLLVSFTTHVIYHAICQRAFLRLLLTRKEFYEAAVEQNLITVKTQP